MYFQDNEIFQKYLSQKKKKKAFCTVCTGRKVSIVPGNSEEGEDITWQVQPFGYILSGFGKEKMSC